MAEIVYIGDAKKCITGVHASIQLNEEGIIVVEKGSPEEQMCQNAKLRNLSELSEKYLNAPKPEGIIGKIFKRSETGVKENSKET